MYYVFQSQVHLHLHLRAAPILRRTIIMLSIVQIIKEVNALKLGSEVSVAPKDQIAEEDWITPEEFRVLAENTGSDGSC